METSNMFGSTKFILTIDFIMILKIKNKNILRNGSPDRIRQLDFGAKYGS
jgi:hypothetical protein